MEEELRGRGQSKGGGKGENECMRHGALLASTRGPSCNGTSFASVITWLHDSINCNFCLGKELKIIANMKEPLISQTREDI